MASRTVSGFTLSLLNRHMMSFQYCIYRSIPQILHCSSRSTSQQRPRGGARSLTDPNKVFSHNNWDNVVWDASQESEARRITEEQAADLVSFEKQVEYEDKAYEFWDHFYQLHLDKFFKDRHWLFTEFPELAPEAKLEPPNSHPSNSQSESESEPEPEPESKSCSGSEQCDLVPEEQQQPEQQQCEGPSEQEQVENEHETSQASTNTTTSIIPQVTVSEEEVNDDPDKIYRFFEVGCGAGNTVFPVLKTNNNPNLVIYCCDFSSKAIDLVKEHPEFEPSRCYPFVCDITNEYSPVPFEENSLDIIIMIFVLNAISPNKMQQTVNRLSSYLKPGGLLLFRDYGRYDMAQLRFKKGRCLSENFYVRQDGTRVYFFTQDELRQMFTQAGLEEEQNIIDRRLQVNRSRQLKMYRVWIQCKYRKPLSTS
ncbi:tRNA N(3)-methylcytidine methyltransferase METTL2 isoform X1 [Octopus sinensis]|uniref:tRNA N(3)-methylcytidine methyltransferase n=1 Tax=Octopus sinensis TaxID=2607531 RepID=A0A6P7STP9_9MOLL|nr:tRNA N(3)-methylcytidine methyltransferase METTL2 isoform X1 [Octopus sinensis]